MQRFDLDIAALDIQDMFVAKYSSEGLKSLEEVRRTGPILPAFACRDRCPALFRALKAGAFFVPSSSMRTGQSGRSCWR
eukprot:SAG22_NODE_494_length_9810_cov_2.202966_8_plen_79_part_00